MQNNESSTLSHSGSAATMPVTNSGDDSKTADAGGMNDLRQAAHDFQDRNGQHHPIAEFLYQLTKMLTDDNSEIIEWADGRIRVHHPERLEAEVLHKYFRHSKFASFQRQLNYFGFRKIAGKGKMSPCSYVNDAATSDIRSLLLIKRKTNGSAARKAAMQQRAVALGAHINPALAGINLQALASGGQALSMLNPQALQSAMALLQENALRAGLGQLPLQQGGNALNSAQFNILALQQAGLLQQQQQHSTGTEQQQQSNQPTSASQAQQQQLQAKAQQQQQDQQVSSSGRQAPSSTALEQLQAQLTALAQAGGAAFNQSALNIAASMPNAASLKLAAAAQDSGIENPATAALKQASASLNAQTSSMPATAAMDAASATAQSNTNLFDSAANLKSLLNENSAAAAAAAASDSNNPRASAANMALLRRLPSSGTIFPENSTLSFGNMLGSSNRLNSLLSLTSWGAGSREPSLVDLAAAANVGAQLAAAAASSSSNNTTNAVQHHLQHAAAAGGGGGGGNHTLSQQFQQAVADANKVRSSNP